jgi:hypothetical protein
MAATSCAPQAYLGFPLQVMVGEGGLSVSLILVHILPLTPLLILPGVLPQSGESQASETRVILLTS